MHIYIKKTINIITKKQNFLVQKQIIFYMKRHNYLNKVRTNNTPQYNRRYNNKIAILIIIKIERSSPDSNINRLKRNE